MTTQSTVIEYEPLIHRRRQIAAQVLATRRVLLIEDNKSDRLIIKRMLHDVWPNQPFEYSDASRMIDALELIDKELFDLILLDLSLPDIDGIAAVATIHGVAPNVPIVVYSGTNDPRMKEEAFLCGAKHYLVKGKESPFSFKFMIENAFTK